MIRARKDVFTTATGRVLYVLEPDPSQICIEDIANSAAKTGRFNGHVRPDVEFYSVAQHAVLVSHTCFSVHAAEGAAHDAVEAYVQDVIRGMKHALGDGYGQIESAWTAAVDEAFGFHGRLMNLPADVKNADRRVLAQERRDLCTLTEVDAWIDEFQPLDQPIVPLLPFAARALFMARWRQLFPEALERFLTPDTLASLVGVP